MRWRWLTVSLWLLAAFGLAWICGAVATYTGLAGGAVLGSLCSVALVWGFLLRGYGKEGRLLAALFQTTVSSGTIAALAIVTTWPLMTAWQDQVGGPAQQWILPIAGSALAGLLLALGLVRWVQMLPVELRLAGGFPEARALAGLFVNDWSERGGWTPGVFWRSVFAGGATKAIAQLVGGTPIGPVYLGLGALMHRQAAQALLAGALAARFAVEPLAAAVTGAPAERGAICGAAAGLGGLIAVFAVSMIRSAARIRLGFVAFLTVAVACVGGGGWWLGGTTGSVAILAGVLVALVLAYLLVAATGTSLLSLVTLGVALAPAAVAKLLVRDFPTHIAVIAASLSCVAGLFAADFFQTVRVNAHIAGTNAPSAGRTAWLKVVGAVAGLSGALWAAGVVADGTALGSVTFSARQAALVSRTISSVLAGRFPLELVVAGAALAVAAELLGRRGWLFATGMFVPLPTALLLGTGAWLADCGRTERVRPAVASGLIAGDLLAQGTMAFGVGWGLMNLKRVPWNPVIAGGAALALLVYLLIEHRADPSNKPQA